MSLNDVPASVILFIITQTALAAWSIISLFFDVKAMKIRVTDLEKHMNDSYAKIESENKALKEDIRKVSDTLLLVQHSVDLLVLGKLKTGSQK